MLTSKEWHNDEMTKPNELLLVYYDGLYNLDVTSVSYVVRTPFQLWTVYVAPCMRYQIPKWSGLYLFLNNL